MYIYIRTYYVLHIQFAFNIDIYIYHFHPFPLCGLNRHPLHGFSTGGLTIKFINLPGHRPTSSKMCYQAIFRTSDWRQREENGRNAGNGKWCCVFWTGQIQQSLASDSDFGTMLGCVGVADLKRRWFQKSYSAEESISVLYGNQHHCVEVI